MPEEMDMERLEAQRERLYEELSQVGDCRGVSAVRRKCGKPNCACERPVSGKGRSTPTRWEGEKTRTMHLRKEELEKAEREEEEWERFEMLTEQIAEVNEEI